MPEGPARAIVIAGPTASGKSRLALAVAERAGGVVICADSMQVYRGLEVLTAQPAAAERARVPHRLYGVLDVAERCSAGRWRDMALAEIARAREGGRLPVVTGGTGLYLKALLEGIAPVPDIATDVRARVRARHRELGNAGFHRELAARDPEGARRIRATDPQRMVRAMEVLEATGRPLAEWQRMPPERGPAEPCWRTVLLMPPREELYTAIDARFERMIAAGAMAEVRALAARKLDADLPAMKALGVAPLLALLRGEMNEAEAFQRAKTETRNYAKRQMTWFRGQMIANLTYDKKFSESFSKEIVPEIIKSA